MLTLIFICGYSVNLADLRNDWLLGDLGYFFSQTLLFQEMSAKSGPDVKFSFSDLKCRCWMGNVCNQRWQQSTKYLVIVKFSDSTGEVFCALVKEITKYLWDQFKNAKPENIILEGDLSGLFWCVPWPSGLIEASCSSFCIQLCSFKSHQSLYNPRVVFGHTR